MDERRCELPSYTYTIPHHILSAKVLYKMQMVKTGIVKLRKKTRIFFVLWEDNQDYFDAECAISLSSERLLPLLNKFNGRVEVNNSNSLAFQQVENLKITCLRTVHQLVPLPSTYWLITRGFSSTKLVIHLHKYAARECMRQSCPSIQLDSTTDQNVSTEQLENKPGNNT